MGALRLREGPSPDGTDCDRLSTVVIVHELFGKCVRRFLQSEKLRCESRHGNPYLIIHAGHLNLAQSGHYNFATTILVHTILVMLNFTYEYC